MELLIDRTGRRLDPSASVPSPGSTHAPGGVKRACVGLAFVIVAALEGAAAPLLLERPGTAQRHVTFPAAAELGCLVPESCPDTWPAAQRVAPFEAYLRQLGRALVAPDAEHDEGAGPVALALAASAMPAPGGSVVQALRLPLTTADADVTMTSAIGAYMREVPEPMGLVVGGGALALWRRRRGVFRAA